MNYKTLERLEYLRKRNSNRQWINRDLYRLMYSEDLYIVAYERIKSKPGNMTEGSDGETLDGFSLKAIRTVIQEMRTEKFCFKPVRQQFIPKPNGKMRKLGIPCVRDKIVQEVIHVILEAIYDSPYTAYFHDASHGFRPHRSCHTALREYRRDWTGVNWIVEGDIRACFDELDHGVMVNTLRKKIQDERFLNLIRKLINAGYMDLNGNKRDSLIGSPQGGIVSPILANIYLHELDEFVEDLRQRREKGKKKRKNPEYDKIAKYKRRLVAQGHTKTKEYRTIIRKMRSLPSVKEKDPEFIRIKYLCYADDWICGVSGSRALAEEITQEVKSFLKDHLKLTLSEEKTHITNAKTEEAHFLGTTLTVGTGGTQKVVLTTNQSGKRFKRRSTGWETVMYAPISKVIQRLKDKGICTPEGEPTAKGGWEFLDADQIVALYSAINRGIQNYYRFVDNWKKLSRVQYILQHSLAKTLAKKLKISMKSVFKRYGKDLCICVPGENGRQERKVFFYRSMNWSKNREAFQGGNVTGIDQLQRAIRMRTRSKLGKPCCICGKAAVDVQIVMHHVRHVRKLSHGRKPVGFNRILRALNRKQIPVCEPCHQKIHRGEYDSYNLSNLTYLPT